MIRLAVEQGSREWLQAKAGIVSASNLHKVLTPSTMKPSKSMDAYAHELLAEQLLGMPLDDATSQFMERGTLLEKAARDWYELQKDVDVERVGFIMRDDGRVGCSPDGLVGEDGGLEIKCPSAAVHLGYLINGPDEKFRCQVQGSLWICKRAHWDFVSHNPDLPSLLVRFERDEKFINALALAVEQLLDYINECKEKLQREYGLFEGFEREPLRVVA